VLKVVPLIFTFFYISCSSFCVGMRDGRSAIFLYTKCVFVDFGGLVVSVLDTGPKVRGFDPDRGRWIFKGDKNPEHHFLRKGSKAVGPMS
jgi:hypothetical protein